MHQSKVHMIPIFYDVRPSEVRRTEKGIFRPAFVGAAKYTQKEEWKFFLQKTGYLSGWKFSDFRCVQGLTLIVNAVEDDRNHSFVVPKSKVIRKKGGPLVWSLSSFARMTELQLLILEDARVEGDFGFSRGNLCAFIGATPRVNLFRLDCLLQICISWTYQEEKIFTCGTMTRRYLYNCWS
ncbi:uncharacterized protein LOC18423893 [Amborella trichopoda]|nr:uncharacterized protein LOC18423893 [Amborella trichopoda]|eukprot:XP_020531025.1 uncharacterized protein LOC18423893 [Amborella trichopoda]